jgi:putative ABC transport system ATP-binding protein
VVIVSHDQRIRTSPIRVLWLEDGEFKEMTTMVTDRVWDVSGEGESGRQPGVGREEYFFCSQGCRVEFQEEQVG